MGRDRSEHRLRNSAILEVINDDQESIGESLGSLILNEAWDHAVRVHLDDVLELDATIIWLELHPSQNVVRDNIATDLGLVSFDQSLVALA